MNRPPNFSGIIRSGTMSVEASPQTLRIGDPVTLSVRLSGFANPEALVLPALERLADFSGQFVIPEEQAPPRVRTNEARYVQSIRPLRTAVTQVPGLQLVVFDRTPALIRRLRPSPFRSGSGRWEHHGPGSGHEHSLQPHWQCCRHLE